ncbi:ribonuclease II [Forsythia ovata]|uniref:Ribonuclease II n=1 Tax=Forsythia ovata TaxID=205694 RepID=A0ABD1T767_9LAMI
MGSRCCRKDCNKDSERVLLAVAQKPDGKKNWMVSDQYPTLLEFVWIELLEKNKSIRVEELAEFYGGSMPKRLLRRNLKEFVKLLKSSRKMPSHSKPTKSSWRTKEKIRHISND